MAEVVVGWRTHASAQTRRLVRRIVWTAEAVANLESIFAYVSAFNASAAVRLARRLQSAADSLRSIQTVDVKQSVDCESLRSSILT